MRCGSLGILLGDIFDPDSSKYVEDNFIYLTIAVNMTDYLKERYPKINRIIFEARYYLIEKDSDKTCVAIYLSDSLVPDEIIQAGQDFRTSSAISDNKWKYHKVLLSINDKVEVVYIHESSLSYFTWFHTEKTDSREDDSIF